MNISAASFVHDGREPSDDDIFGCDVSDAALEAAASTADAGRRAVISQCADREHSGHLLQL
jgi:hypothetical protein